ncbi:response regulator transcription factor [Streptomyces sp. TRM66268-LWL]|uniref:Response regulator transcription factor n=1 Tax=Streptomyces polyasparticus TaxID=2767826 RepID=A0ABR7SRK9_9ACTN|nr:LuxR C-terminal-related transcriptional regulator [Streptomyces polyasparticus]MBC9717587.1 response regulator transcription factor [Streptomyces polyasparticus]
MDQRALPEQDFSAFADPGRFSGPQRLRVTEAMTRLEAERLRVVRAMERGQPVAARVLGRGGEEINRNLSREVPAWRTLDSINANGSVEQLAVSLPNNTFAMNAGLRMTSVWHRDALSPEVRLVLSGEDPEVYFFGYGPLQMKIVDRVEVLLAGPVVRNRTTVIVVRDAACVAAARHYWDAVRATAYPCAAEEPPADGLTERQRRVVALLLTCSSDEQIARRLGLSVRTVRTEVAVILDLLDAPTRFVAGVRLRERLSRVTS